MNFRKFVSILSTFNMDSIHDSQFKSRSECLSQCAHHLRKLPGMHNQVVFAALERQHTSLGIHSIPNDKQLTGLGIKMALKRTTPVHIDIEFDYDNGDFYWGNGDRVHRDFWVNKGGVNYPILETRVLAQCLMNVDNFRQFTNRTQLFTAQACDNRYQDCHTTTTNPLVRNRVLCQDQHVTKQHLPFTTYEEAEKVKL